MDSAKAPWGAAMTRATATPERDLKVCDSAETSCEKAQRVLLSE